MRCVIWSERCGHTEMRLVRVTHRNVGLLQERRWVRRHLSWEHNFCQLELLNSFSFSVSLSLLYFIFWRNHTFGDSPNTRIHKVNEQSTFKSAWYVRPWESFRSRLSFRFGCRAGLWDYSSHTLQLNWVFICSVCLVKDSAVVTVPKKQFHKLVCNLRPTGSSYSVVFMCAYKQTWDWVALVNV